MIKLNDVFGLHCAASALSRIGFPYQRQTDQYSKKVTFEETVISHRFTDEDEMALCQKCFLASHRRFKEHKLFNSETSTKFLYLQRHVVRAGPQLQFGREESVSVRAEIQNEDRRSQEINDLINDLVEPGRSINQPQAEPPGSVFRGAARAAARVVGRFSRPFSRGMSSSRGVASSSVAAHSSRLTAPTAASSTAVHTTAGPSTAVVPSSAARSTTSQPPQFHIPPFDPRRSRTTKRPPPTNLSSSTDSTNNDDDDESDYYIPIGPGNADYEGSDTDSDDDSNDPFSSFESNDDKCTAFWNPPAEFNKKIAQYIISDSLRHNVCIICGEQRPEDQHYKLSWTNLWGLLEYEDLNLMNSSSTHFVCKVSCLNDRNQLTVFAKNALEQSDQPFRVITVKERFHSRFVIDYC